MVRVTGVQEPYGDTVMKKWGSPWKNLLLESDKMLMEDGDFLLCEKGGKIFFEASALVSEDSFKFHLEAGRPEFLRWGGIHDLILENGFRIVLNYPYGHSSFGIYCRRRTAKGQYVVREKFYNERIPATPARLVCQSKFALAVAAWQGLTSEQKAVYNRNVSGRHMAGFNLYISNYLKT
jgi:hypothetical protein